MEPKHRSRNSKAERVPSRRLIRNLRAEVRQQGKEIDSLIDALDGLADAVLALPYFSKRRLAEYVDDLEEPDDDQETSSDR